MINNRNLFYLYHYHINSLLLELNEMRQDQYGIIDYSFLFDLN